LIQKINGINKKLIAYKRDPEDKYEVSIQQHGKNLEAKTIFYGRRYSPTNLVYSGQRLAI